MVINLKLTPRDLNPSSGFFALDFCALVNYYAIAILSGYSICQVKLFLNFQILLKCLPHSSVLMVCFELLVLSVTLF